MTLSFSAFFSLLFLLGRLTSNTKNQAVKKVPIVIRTVASIGNAAGEIGEMYRTIESILCLWVAGREYDKISCELHLEKD